MPTLHNPTDQDVYSHAIGEIVPAGGSVEIDDEQAARVNTVSGVWRVTAAAKADAPATASRTSGKRGGKRAEVSAAPAMETR